MVEINAPKTYEQYQKKYPKYNMTQIIDVMLDDQVITFETADKLKSSISLFLFNIENSPQQNNGIFDITEIMGGKFSQTKISRPKFNKKIDIARQSKNQADCWLLSDINALSQKKWGAKAISDAIIPDTDESGGVTIRFKGSPLKNKDIHITAKEIDDAKKIGIYADGDDDVIALELAVEKTFKEMVKLGLAKRGNTDEEIKKAGTKYRSYIYYGVSFKQFGQYPISELLGIHQQQIDIGALNESKTALEDKTKIFKWLNQKQEDVALTCSFAPLCSYGDENSKNFVHEGHSYAIKQFSYGHEVILRDPTYPDYEIKIPWKNFKDMLRTIEISFKSDNIQQECKKILPKNYESNLQNYYKKHKELLMEEYVSSNQSPTPPQKPKEQIDKEKKEVIDLLKQSYAKNDETLLLDALQKLNEDVVIDVLDKYPDLIAKIDKLYFGWGKGSAKKLMLSFITESLTEKARSAGIDSDKIDHFEKTCNKELNAIFYTNEKTIIEEVDKMKKLIRNKSVKY